MNIIRLGLTDVISLCISAVDHSTMHRYRLLRHSFEKARAIRRLQGIDPAFRQGKVDGLGEVERYSIGIS